MKVKSLIKISDVPYLYLHSSMFEGEIDEVITKIKNIRVDLSVAIKRVESEYPDNTITPYSEYKRIEIEIDRYYGDVNLICYREETDDEYKKRMEKQKESKKKREEAAKKRQETIKKKELELYNKLKEKYG